MTPRALSLAVFTTAVALASFMVGCFVGGATSKPQQHDSVGDIRSKLNEVIDRVNVIDSELYELQCNKKPH